MFGTRIKELRQSLGMNQVQFGKSLNVTKQSVSNWENGNIQPSIDMLIKISSTFSVSTDYLLGITSERSINADGLSPRKIVYIQYLVNELKSNRGKDN